MPGSMTRRGEASARPRRDRTRTGFATGAARCFGGQCDGQRSVDRIL